MKKTINLKKIKLMVNMLVMYVRNHLNIGTHWTNIYTVIYLQKMLFFLHIDVINATKHFRKNKT